ncbi:hypothetical protein BDN70DRAFT_937707 [Pholiota conissans]|uniref:Uncharacterized protein n=1 Tax=Pholiota conissans TaxID=109636 RepID=A0A9P5YQ69_9AGAR|nr:hypothetical protein BDN70DRAFT_937707 [Pholiota conissans]
MKKKNTSAWFWVAKGCAIQECEDRQDDAGIASRLEALPCTCPLNVVNTYVPILCNNYYNCSNQVLQQRTTSGETELVPDSNANLVSNDDADFTSSTTHWDAGRLRSSIDIHYFFDEKCGPTFRDVAMSSNHDGNYQEQLLHVQAASGLDSYDVYYPSAERPFELPHPSTSVFYGAVQPENSNLNFPHPQAPDTLIPSTSRFEPSSATQSASIAAPAAFESASR